MAKFIIQPHDRLHEMVAHELGYFSAEGLDYEIDTRVPAQASKLLESAGHVKEIRSGATSPTSKARATRAQNPTYPVPAIGLSTTPPQTNWAPCMARHMW